MVKTIKKIVADNKRIGFVVNIDGFNRYLSDVEILQLMAKGYNFDITKDGRGFRFIDGNRKISDLESVPPQKTEPSRKKVIYSAYTGSSLKSYVLTNVDNKNNREFVGKICAYCKKQGIYKEPRVLAVSGLRGTGKTIGILQAIKELGKYEDSVYIDIDANADMDCLDLRDLILTQFNDKQFIFVDEITRVKDIINKASFLSDTLVMNGKRVVLSGTDSLALVEVKKEGLYHRVFSINTTHLNYRDYLNTTSGNLKSYIVQGGLYHSDKIASFYEMCDYIETAVVSNIMNTLQRNKSVTSLLDLAKIDAVKLRTIVFKIIYAVVYSNTQRASGLTVNFMINLYDFKDVTDKGELNSLVCDLLDLSSDIVPTQQEVIAVLKAMNELGLLIRLENMRKPMEYKYYITNPSLVYQVLLSIRRVLGRYGTLKSSVEKKHLYGDVFESIVVTHTKLQADIMGFKTYYYHDEHNAEIDLIVEQETGDAFDDLYLYYEIKLTDESDTAIAQTKWLNSPLIQENDNSRVVARSIIYRGGSKIFKGFEANDVSPPKGFTLDEIESQNLGISLINAEDYLLYSKKYLKVLEE